MLLQGEVRGLVAGVRGLALVHSEAPKKPANPFATFVKDQVPKYRQTFPGVKQTEIFSKISADWKRLPTAKKAPMEKAFEHKKAEWQKAMEALPEEVKMDLLADRRAKQTAKRLRTATIELKVMFIRLPALLLNWAFLGGQPD
jgi:hypothetical protein